MIKLLDKNSYEKYPITFSYETKAYYDVSMTTASNTIQITLTKKPFDRAVKKSFVDYLYEPYRERAEAYGYFRDETLVGIIEIDFEAWSKRLRISECIVFEAFQRQGIATKLMQFASERGMALGARALVLETQSCNVNAIDFYHSVGFELSGLDTLCYSNQDIENREVRLELGKKL